MNKHKSNKIKENSNTVRHLIMGQITTTQNLVAIKEVRHAGHNILKCIFLKENVQLLIKIPLKFVPRSPINNIPALIQLMAWCRPGNKPLSEPMMAQVTYPYMCITSMRYSSIQSGLCSCLPCWCCPPKETSCPHHVLSKMRRHWGCHFNIKMPS